MPRNIREVYEDGTNLLRKFNERLNPVIPEEFGGGSFSYFDGAELGYPVVVDDDLTKDWLELNYLFSTGFRPDRRPGIGEIGADIRTVEEIDGQKYLTVPIVLMDATIRALSDFRDVEVVCSEWLDNQANYSEAVSALYNKVEDLSEQHPQLEGFKKIFEKAGGYIGYQRVGLPSEDFVHGLGRLGALLEDLSENETSREASRLSQELMKYSSAIPQMKNIREYHKNVPHITDDGIIRISTPPASGGLCMHTHPGYDDSYEALPSQSDLIIIAAQSGSVGVFHIGAGETRGEHYIMHIPRKFFFDEVREIVDKERVSDETGIVQIKQTVLDRRLDDIMDGEILGFKIDGNNGRRIAVLSPVVTAREYERHKGFLESGDLEGQPFGVKDMLLDAGHGYARYQDEVKDFLAENIGNLTKGE